MGPLDAPQEELDALDRGRAFADLSTFRKVRVGGADARAWLNDLVTCDVATIAPGISRRSLLLSPTGRILADLAVAQDADGLILLQSAAQPDHVSALLGRYILSSDVSVDRIDGWSMFAVPADGGRSADRSDPTVMSPSVLGSGVDLLAHDEGAAGGIEAALVRRNLLKVGADSLEVWRIRRGAPRMGADFAQDSLPAEVGLEHTIDLAKGCFLGQEAVAKVRNLGHPASVLRHVRVAALVGAATPVMAGHEVAGAFTSAAVAGDAATVGIVRVRWEFAAAELRAPDGATIVAVGSMD